MCTPVLKNGSLPSGATSMGRGSAPMWSAMDKGSPVVGADVDEMGVVWRPRWRGFARAQERSRQPPVSGMSTLCLPGLPERLNQISDPSPVNPRLRRRFPGVNIGGMSSVRLAKLPGAHLTHPDVELSGLVGEEGHEPAVGRDFGSLFRALPIRDLRERGVRERVTPRSVRRWT